MAGGDVVPRASLDDVVGVVASSSVPVDGSLPALQVAEGDVGFLTPFDVVSSSCVARSVQNILDNERPGVQRLMLFPWETNPWLRCVFGSQPNLLDLPVPLEPLASIVPSVQPGPLPNRYSPKRCLPRRKRAAVRPWIDVVDDARQAAVNSWYKILQGREKASRLGRQLLVVEDLEEKMAILLDTFADKATATLRVRAYYFSKLVDWVEKGGESCLTITENQV